MRLWLFVVWRLHTDLSFFCLVTNGNVGQDSSRISKRLPMSYSCRWNLWQSMSRLVDSRGEIGPDFSWRLWFRQSRMNHSPTFEGYSPTGP